MDKFLENELDKNSACKDFLHTAKRQVIIVGTKEDKAIIGYFKGKY